MSELDMQEQVKRLGEVVRFLVESQLEPYAHGTSSPHSDNLREMLKTLEPLKPSPTEMPDAEFLAQYATLGEEWWPEWVDDDGDDCRLAYEHCEWGRQWHHNSTWCGMGTPSNAILAALCESYCQKKLREMEEPIATSRNSFHLDFAASKAIEGTWFFLSPSGNYLQVGDRARYPTFRHALLAAARAK